MSVGSPNPFRTRSPCPDVPDLVPAPSTSVRKRYAGAELAQRGEVTASFSFDAGASDVSALRAKSVCPVARSTAIAAGLRGRESRDCERVREARRQRARCAACATRRRASTASSDDGDARRTSRPL